MLHKYTYVKPNSPMFSKQLATSLNGYFYKMTLFHPLMTNEVFLKETHELFCYLEEAAQANINKNNSIIPTENKTESKSKFMASLDWSW